jgi:hypothetical protein
LLEAGRRATIALQLRLYADGFAPNRASAPLSAKNRVIYLAQGHALLRSHEVVSCLAYDSAWHGGAEVAITAGADGARMLRWELSPSEPEILDGGGIQSELTLEAQPHIERDIQYLMRCDRVDFPPGGVAYTHVHQGPGIRCLQSGRIRIDTQGRSFWVEPGGAWFETGSDPVFAATWPDGPSHFIRVMILPRAIQGKSSIRYVKAEDQDKPRTQTYRVFVDEFIDF